MSLKFFYHGSRTAGIKTLEPHQHRLFTHKVVFATLDSRFALAMIYGTADELAVGYVRSTKTNQLKMYIDELQPNRLQLLDGPGYLYTVSPRGFQPSRRLAHVEFVSQSEVEVLEELAVANVLEEMKKRPPDPRNMLE